MSSKNRIFYQSKILLSIFLKFRMDFPPSKIISMPHSFMFRILLFSLLIVIDWVNMKLFSPFSISFVLFIFCNKFAHSAQDCLQHTSEVCKSTNVWTDGAFCNAIYGNYPGNKQNLQKLMYDHFKQSFQFIVTVIYTQIIHILYYLAHK